jgi:hypothetical protein
MQEAETQGTLQPSGTVKLSRRRSSGSKNSSNAGGGTHKNNGGGGSSLSRLAAATPIEWFPTHRSAGFLVFGTFWDRPRRLTVSHLSLGRWLWMDGWIGWNNEGHDMFGCDTTIARLSWLSVVGSFVLKTPARKEHPALQWEGAWQTETSRVDGCKANPCTLYYRTRQQLVETQASFQLQQRQLTRTEKTDDAIPKRHLSAPLPELQYLFDQDMVSALAKGKRVPMGNTKSNRQTNGTDTCRPAKRTLQSGSSDIETDSASITKKTKVSFQEQDHAFWSHQESSRRQQLTQSRPTDFIHWLISTPVLVKSILIPTVVNMIQGGIPPSSKVVTMTAAVKAAGRFCSAETVASENLFYRMRGTSSESLTDTGGDSLAQAWAKSMMARISLVLWTTDGVHELAFHPAGQWHSKSWSRNASLPTIRRPGLHSFSVRAMPALVQ